MTIRYLVHLAGGTDVLRTSHGDVVKETSRVLLFRPNGSRLNVRIPRKNIVDIMVN